LIHANYINCILEQYTPTSVKVINRTFTTAYDVHIHIEIVFKNHFKLYISMRVESIKKYLLKKATIKIGHLIKNINTFINKNISFRPIDIETERYVRINNIKQLNLSNRVIKDYYILKSIDDTIDQTDYEIYEKKEFNIEYEKFIDLTEIFNIVFSTKNDRPRLFKLKDTPNFTLTLNGIEIEILSDIVFIYLPDIIDVLQFTYIEREIFLFDLLKFHNKLDNFLEIITIIKLERL
jgi:hypothetical protein